MQKYVCDICGKEAERPKRLTTSRLLYGIFYHGDMIKAGEAMEKRIRNVGLDGIPGMDLCDKCEEALDKANEVLNGKQYKQSKSISGRK